MKFLVHTVWKYVFAVHGRCDNIFPRWGMRVYKNIPKLDTHIILTNEKVYLPAMSVEYFLIKEIHLHGI